MELSSLTLDGIRNGTINVKNIRKDALEKHSGEIAYIGEPIGYEDFFLRHLIPNRPCVFGVWVTAGWRSRREWVTADGLPDTDYLREHFGATVVPVADCGRVEYSAQPKEDFTMVEYLEYLRDRTREAHGEEDRCLYLKDWHFTRSHPDYEAYRTPVFFQSDWLNEFWDGRRDEKDDYRFVYFGPKGSWTPLHADVLRSYSWSANVCGTKRWWLFPPGEEEKLKDTFGQLAYDLRSEDVRDPRRFPRYVECAPPLEVIQRAGEIIFVPSGWHHQVFNLEDTVSINHNWLNGCSVDLSWEYVKASMRDVQHEIRDCCNMDGWNAQCQLILKACSGIDYAEFYRFLHLIATNRLRQLDANQRGAYGVTPTSQHITATPQDIIATSQNTTATSHTITARSQDITATSQDITATSLDITATSQDITATSQDITPISQDITSTSQDITATSQDIFATSQDITATSQDITATSQDITTTSQDITATSQDITATSHDITATSHDIFATSQIAASHNTTPTSHDTTATSHDTTPTSQDPHLIFDLFQIVGVIEDMLNTREFTELDNSTFEEDPHELCTRIRLVL